jgi:hypothetical protein
MTISELIERLKAFDPDIPVVIEDADTCWLLTIESVDLENGVARISGDYGNLHEENQKNG